MHEPDKLDPDKIKENLRTRRIGQEVIVYDSTSSTNDIAAEYAKNKNNNGLAVFTEEQTAGRGRSGNKWLTDHGDSILCSVLLTESECTAELLALVCAVATAEAIGKLGRNQPKIKWPNDVLIAGKKIAGILLETTSNNGQTTYVLGIGINCHQQKGSLPDEIKSTATSIDIETNAASDRVSLAKRLLTSLDHWLDLAERKPKKVIKQWRKSSILYGHRVTLIYNGKNFTGNCIGIDPEKGLILQLDIGGVRFFDAAHTSIVK